MSYPKYQRMQDELPIPQSPPPYQENQPYLPKTSTESTHCVEHEKFPGVPPQDLPIYGPDETASKHIQQPRSVIIVPVQPTEEPDYMAYSIFTILCCFLPLGVAAFVFSKLTQKANREGNMAAAQRHSKTAVILAHTSLGIGVPLIILYLIFIMK